MGNKNTHLLIWLTFITLTSLLTACGGGNDLHFNSVLSASVTGMEETAGLVLSVNGNEISPIKKVGVTTLLDNMPVGDKFDVTIQKQPKDFQWCSLQGNVGEINETKNSVDVFCSISGVQVSTMIRATDGTLYRNGTLGTAAFDKPRAMMVDKLGNIYVADENYVIRKITPDGVVTRYAGQPGVQSSVDGDSTTASFTEARAMEMDKDGVIYFTDRGGKIRKIATDGSISTFFSMATDGPSYFNQNGRTTNFRGLKFNSAGDLFVTDDGLRVIYKIKSDKSISIFAGTPYSTSTRTTKPAIDGGPGVGIFGVIFDLAIDKEDNLYAADRIHGYRKVDTNGVISTPHIVNISDNLSYIAIDEFKNIYMVGVANTSAIAKFSPGGKVDVLAGVIGSPGYVDGNNSEVRFTRDLSGIVIDSMGNILVSDMAGNAIRKVVPIAP
jgi:hypothetical protein